MKSISKIVTSAPVAAFDPDWLQDEYAVAMSMPAMLTVPLDDVLDDSVQKLRTILGQLTIHETAVRGAA